MKNTVIPTVTAIAIGAIPGALIRYLITELTQAVMGKDVAYYGTFMINVTGCFMISLFYTLNEQRINKFPSRVRLAIATGFCGAYTTFSTYGLETLNLIDRGNTTVGFIYWFGSMMVGMIAVKLGSLSRS
ncbi:MAG: fluoride efflux transporter CrcB [Synechococcales bacterium]|nr:fluoride efflux transporter CrcB [Synechococcales bacterium]